MDGDLPYSLPVIPERWRRTGLGLAALVVLASTVLARAQGLPAVLDPPPPAPEQPLPYSHRQHLDLGLLDCSDCHVKPDPGFAMTFPDTVICMSCHETMPAGADGAKRLAAFAAEGRPIPWVRVYELPDYVYWSHDSHLAAGITCTDCHGPVAERDVMRRETNVASKNGCLTCHETRQVFSDCGDCHEPRQ